MPILEDIAGMGPDAMETFTPPEMGADVRLAEAKQRIGDKVCMIGGFNQAHYFWIAPKTKHERLCGVALTKQGRAAAISSVPSDHFFDADPNLLAAFADEARQCVYK